MKLFSAMRYDRAVVVAQVAVPTATTEVTQVKRLLASVDVAGLVVTADAAHPSADTAAYLARRHGDYVFTVKANKPGLLAGIATRLPAATGTTAGHTESERRNGEIICRRVWTRRRPGLPRRRDRVPAAPRLLRPGRPARAQGDRAWRDQPARRQPGGHCLPRARTLGIENKIHWVRDVLLAEDRHRAWRGSVAHGMALIRNLAIGLIRLTGKTKIKEVLEHNQADRMELLPLLRASRPKIN